ncbi:MAG: hypothetical protein GX638_00785 [Crenarchaeota archaeon]|nr:hypothetical protein [Thermoproteota archaeon]
MILKLTPFMAIFLLFSSTVIQPIQAIPIPAIQQSLDTLENDTDLIVERKTWRSYPFPGIIIPVGDTTVPVDTFMPVVDTTIDTVYRSKMIRELIESYKSSDYVFIATAVFSALIKNHPVKIIDTLDTDTEFIPPYQYTDSLIIQIDTVLKSSTQEIFDGYQYPVVTRYVALTTKDPVSLSWLKGRYLIVFTNDLNDCIKPLVRNYPQGFYVDDNGMIIHDYYNGVSFPFEDFLQMSKETPVRKNSDAKRPSETIRFHSHCNGSLSLTIPFDLLTNKVEMAIYDLSGALISRKMQPVHSSSTILTFSSLSKGVYTIVISGHDSEKKAFKTSIRHCISR